MNDTDMQQPAWVAAGPGVERRVRAHDPNLMLVEVRFEAGASGAVHSHPHTQITYVVSGSFDFTLDGSTRRLTTGHTLLVPSHVDHGCVCVEPGMLVDVFTPRRDDFL